jgi:hypothetical protein
MCNCWFKKNETLTRKLKFKNANARKKRILTVKIWTNYKISDSFQRLKFYKKSSYANEWKFKLRSQISPFKSLKICHKTIKFKNAFHSSKFLGIITRKISISKSIKHKKISQKRNQKSPFIPKKTPP